MSGESAERRFVLIRPRRGETDDAARARVMAEHPDVPDDGFRFAREIFNSSDRNGGSTGGSKRGRRGGGPPASSRGGSSVAGSSVSGPPPPPASPWFMGPVTFGAAPERGSETFRVSGASLEMALSECFPTPALGQRTQWLEAKTTEYSVGEVSDETFRCLQAQGKRVEDVLGPYQFRLYNSLLLKAVKAANSRFAGDVSVYSTSELQAFLDEVGVVHATAPVAEMLSRHFPRRDGGQKYFCPLEDYGEGTRACDSDWVTDLEHLVPFALAEQRGQTAMRQFETAHGPDHARTGCEAQNCGLRPQAADPVQFALDARSAVGQRLGWSNSLKKKVEDFFYRVKATSRGDGPRLVEINFSRWAREDMVIVRSPITIAHGDLNSDSQEIRCRHSATREEVAIDWAFRIRQCVEGHLDPDEVYPEFAGDREAPFFTVVSGREALLRTVVRLLA